MSEPRPIQQLNPTFGPYLQVWVPFWVGMIALLILYGYEGSFLLVHSFRMPWLDSLMPHLTHVGDGLIIAGFTGLLLRSRSAAWYLQLVLVMVLIAVLVGLGKNVWFDDWFRPGLVFPQDPRVFQLSMKPLVYHSFPSGHAAAVTAALSVGAFAWGRKSPILARLLALLSVAVAYSRVYIGVHFVGDILVGSILGSVVSLGVALWVSPLLAKKGWVNRPELRIFWIVFSAICLIGGIIRVYFYYYIP